jgi:hypothetical protein
MIRSESGTEPSPTRWATYPNGTTLSRKCFPEGPRAGYGDLPYLQRFVPPAGDPGFDWRVLVVGGRALAAMRRVSRHWVYNVAQGARCMAAELTPELAHLAEQASAALELDYAGVDQMPPPQGRRSSRSMTWRPGAGCRAWHAWTSRNAWWTHGGARSHLSQTPSSFRRSFR